MEQKATTLREDSQTEAILTARREPDEAQARLKLALGHLPEVTCHVSELNQVFLNLIVNAAHAIYESGKDAATGRITLATMASAEFVTVEMADNGCGIPTDPLDKIFDPFFTTQEVGKDTGQGLAIARSIVAKKHAGSIDVQSERGRGTRFIIRLPISRRARAQTS